jgi:hypothetical protein
MEGISFHQFYLLVPDYMRMSTVARADWCVGAMERGTLPVCVRSSRGDCLWDECVLTTSQWDRICRLRPPLGDLWNKRSLIFATWGTTDDDCVFTAHAPDAITALIQIEYLWTDLDVVDEFVRALRDCPFLQWIADEVDQRRQWAAGLRRAWLAAVVSDSLLPRPTLDANLSATHGVVTPRRQSTKHNLVPQKCLPQ